MMDWTDRHCRYFHRQLSQHVLLYTEMVTAPAVLYGDRSRLLAFDPSEHPVAVQLGGSGPAELAKSTEICVEAGFDEINLNCGCPSDRVQSGTFGAILMANPELVRDCAKAMINAAGDVPVTIKCRIGIDEQDPQEVLPKFIETVVEAGVKHFMVHARKAWLQGLSPKENRDVPPLDYELVLKMKAEFSDLAIGINGGITSLQAAQAFLNQGLDAVMIGRSAYQTPWDILGEADPTIWKTKRRANSAVDAVLGMRDYVEAELAHGTRLNQITRHMLGVFHGVPGARRWRRILSENAHKDGAGWSIVVDALGALESLQPELSV